MLKNDVPITKNDPLNVVYGLQNYTLTIPKDPPNSTNLTRKKNTRDQRWAKVEGIDPALGYKCDKVWVWESSRVGTSLWYVIA